MAVDIKNIRNAIIKTARVVVGDKLATIPSVVLEWQINSLGYVSDENHIFTADTLPETETLRNTYFTDNSSELVETVTCTLKVTGKQPIKYTYQGDRAAVIPARRQGKTSSKVPVKPDYPYISVDYTRMTNSGTDITEKYMNSDGEQIYRTHKLAAFEVRVFGTSNDNTFGICSDLHMMLNVDSIRRLIPTLTSDETSIRSKTDPIIIASLQEDKYKEIASFTLVLAVVDEVVIGESFADGYIERVDFTANDALNGSVATDDGSLEVQVVTNPV